MKAPLILFAVEGGKLATQTVHDSHDEAALRDELTKFAGENCSVPSTAGKWWENSNLWAVGIRAASFDTVRLAELRGQRGL